MKKHKSLLNALTGGANLSELVLPHPGSKQFPKFVAVTITLSGLLGYGCLNLIGSDEVRTNQTRESRQYDNDTNKNEEKVHKSSMENVRLREMIKDARTNNWKENLKTAYDAQSHFMIPTNNPDPKPKFMSRFENNETK